MKLHAFVFTALCLGVTANVSHRENQKNLMSDIELKLDDITISLNKLVDFILEVTKDLFIQDKEIVIHLGDVSKQIGKGVLKGNFKATGGYFKNLASLIRTGDVGFTINGHEISAQAAIGLTEVEGGFNEYDFNMINIHKSGTIKASVDKNSLALNLKLEFAPSCDVQLSELDFVELSGMEVEVTGLGSFQMFFNQISKFIISNFQGQFKNMINNKIYSKVERALKSKDICSYIPVL